MVSMVMVVCRIGANIWFCLELCSGGSVAELARQLVKRGRRLIDDQIAYIVKEVLHALIYLQVATHCPLKTNVNLHKKI